MLAVVVAVTANIHVIAAYIEDTPPPAIISQCSDDVTSLLTPAMVLVVILVI